jgi:hypothetical protein
MRDRLAPGVVVLLAVARLGAPAAAAAVLSFQVRFAADVDGVWRLESS